MVRQNDDGGRAEGMGVESDDGRQYRDVERQCREVEGTRYRGWKGGEVGNGKSGGRRVGIRKTWEWKKNRIRRRCIRT